MAKAITKILAEYDTCGDCVYHNDILEICTINKCFVLGINPIWDCMHFERKKGLYKKESK